MYIMMTRKFLLLIFSAALVLGTPVATYAAQAVEIIDNDFQNINVSVSEQTLRVTGANGQMLFIYNVAGVRVMSLKIEGADKLIDLNLPKGCYIVKVGKVVRKISIK